MASPDWLSGPAKWGAVGALGAASVIGLAWTIAARPGPLPQAPAPTTLVHRAPPDRGAQARPIAPATPALESAPRSAPQMPTPADASAFTKRININTATAAELELLPGIGPALAARIVEHRATHGPFASVDRLDDVKGIGPSKLAKVRPLVRVE